MNSRQRILAALNHVEPDRVPIDLGGHRSSGIAAMAYARLRRALQLPERVVRVYDPVQQLAIVDEDVLDRLGVDTIELGRAFALEDSAWCDWTLPDGTPCQMPRWAQPERYQGGWLLRSPRGTPLARMPDGAVYFEQCHWPFLEADDLGRLPEALAELTETALASPPGPLVQGEDGIDALAAAARRLRATTDRAILGLFGGSLFECGQRLYRTDRFLSMLAGDAARAAAFLERLAEFHLADLERYLGAVGPYIDIIVFVDDLGMQSGSQISPAMYRRLFQPHHARLWRRAKQLAPVKVMLHCCGGVRPLLEDFIEAGLDAINPVQISCGGMEPRGLKRDFGDRLTLWGGGCDTKCLPPPIDVEAIRFHVRAQVEILSPGGGFVFQLVHNVLPDMPPEHVMALFDAVHDG